MADPGNGTGSIGGGGTYAGFISGGGGAQRMHQSSGDLLKRPLTMNKLKSNNHQKYMDKMDEALNKCHEKNIFPHWRKHQSLKGWCSMNYPAIMTNPLLKRAQIVPQYENIKFSNANRPISAPAVRTRRPFSTLNKHINQINILAQGVGGPAVNHNASLASLSQYDNAYSENKALMFGKSFSDFKDMPGSTINTVERVVSAFPQPKKRPAQTAKAKPKEGADTSAGQIGGTTAPVAAVTRPRTVVAKQPEIIKPPPIPETHETAVKAIVSWNNYQHISSKQSVKTLTTSKYHEKALAFENVHSIAKEHSSLLPLQNYFGQTPDPDRDPYDRRNVKQLNDISFGSSEDEEEFEDTKHQKRMPQTILTEETLKDYISVETHKLNLEHHYWIKDNFLDKIGKMAPNLVELSLRRLNISNKAFMGIVSQLKQLQRVDISDCQYIYALGVRLMISNNQDHLVQIQANNCRKAITNEVVGMISNLNLQFLDISYADQVDDEGLASFKEKQMPIQKLIINGLMNITSLGLTDIISSCKDTLKILEASLMNQESMNGQFCVALSFCFQLQELDLTGDNNIQDEGFSHLSRGDIKLENGQTQLVGLKKLRVVKISGLNKISDHSVIKLVTSSQVMEHVELTKCDSLSDYSIDTIIRQVETLKFLDINQIPAITNPIMEQLKLIRPELLIRKFQYNNADVKDNGLRVPRRIVDKKKKKKKKKGGKKKKK